jgi:hypothetical protein
MQGVDDLIDESVWVNVQDPVRQMITAITKAVRTQSAGIRDLDRKVNGLVTTDILDRVVHTHISKVSTKTEVKDVVREMDARTNELSANFSNYEDRLGEISSKLTKMNEILSNQSVAITSLNTRVGRLSEDIEDVRLNPNYDAIYAYIDRQVCHVDNAYILLQTLHNITDFMLHLFGLLFGVDSTFGERFRSQAQRQDRPACFRRQHSSAA